MTDRPDTRVLPPPLDRMPPHIRAAVESYIARRERGEVKNRSTDETPFRTTERKLTP
jgi:hypothetical protein